MERSLKPRFHIADVTLKSLSRSHLHRSYIQLKQSPPSFLERECSYLAEWFPMLYFLFDLILFIPVNIFSVKSYQDGYFLGWTDTTQDLMCLACHVYFFSLVVSVGKGLISWLPCMWCFHVVFCYLPIPYRVLGHVCYLIVWIPYLCLLLYFAHEQYAVPPVRLKPATLLSLLKHSTTWYCTRILCGEQMKVSDYCYDLGVKGLGQYILQMLTWIPLIIFVIGCPYIPKWFLMVGTLKWRFQSTNMTVGSKFKARNMNFCILW